MADEQPRCPDCGGRIEDHNSVNRVPKGLVAHSEQCGACWKSLNTPFVEQVRAYLMGVKETAQARQGRDRSGGLC